MKGGRRAGGADRGHGRALQGRPRQRQQEGGRHVTWGLGKPGEGVGRVAELLGSRQVCFVHAQGNLSVCGRASSNTRDKNEEPGGRLP